MAKQLRQLRKEGVRFYISPNGALRIEPETYRQYIRATKRNERPTPKEESE